MKKKASRFNLFLTVFIFMMFPVLCMLLSACNAQAQTDPSEYYPAEPDAFSGNWEGRWSEEDVDPDVSAQVIALGRDRYKIRLASKIFMRSPMLALIEAKAEDGVLSFDQDGYKGEIRNGIFNGSRRSGKPVFSMNKTSYQSPTLGLTPPANAIVLFNGANFDAWTDPKGWELESDNAMMVLPEAGDLVSKQKFKDVQLHVEFRTPFVPSLGGQARGNSGVFVQDVYEVQVLDSFGLEGTYDECGALYKVSAPRVNACLPPTQWQTYDITYHAARFNDNGTVKTYPQMTVLHNGYVIQKEQEIPWITAWKEVERLQPPPMEPGSIKLQSHHSHHVQFRNVWVVDLESAK
jgi:hypothetical protein